jgi:cation:H+ antiporter
VQSVIKCIEGTGAWAPWLFVGIFLAASFLTIWRLERMAEGGLEGTVLGTLVMPYCSGMGNLIFAYILGRQGGSATEVMTNCLVNNVTNMTLVLGLPAIIWGLNIVPKSADKKNGGTKTAKSKKTGRIHEVNRLSLLLTLMAILFFTGTTWALGSDGRINFFDGLVLVGMFFFWQCFHVYEVLKSNAQQNKSLSWMLGIDVLLLGIGAYAVYISTDWLVNWISNIHSGFISARYIGWLSGWLMVVPNATLAFYYGWTGRPEVVYTSQVGDSHICIPLCIGIFALFKPIQTPSFFTTSAVILLGATLVHFLFIGALGRLPRVVGVALTLSYVYFLKVGLLK